MQCRTIVVVEPISRIQREKLYFSSVRKVGGFVD